MYHTKDSLHITKITLLVHQIKRSLEFYCDILGFSVLYQSKTSVSLTANHQDVLIELIEDPLAKPLGYTQGLYHYALLLKKRTDLSMVLKHLIDKRYPITGASDHGVSEALYLDDPDGHGIEIYIDKPTKEWPYEDDQLIMYTHALDFESLMKEHPKDQVYQLPKDLIMGHLHYHVPSLEEAQKFYCDLLGFKPMFHYSTSALFIADKNYHHHLGLNTWQEGAPLCEKRQIGLKAYVLNVPSHDYLLLLKRLHEAHIAIHDVDGEHQITDPLGQTIILDFQT